VFSDVRIACAPRKQYLYREASIVVPACLEGTVHASFISLTSDLCYAKITHTTLFITSYTAHRAHKSPRIDLQAPPPHTGSIYNERPSILFTSANVYERQTSITTAKSCSWTWWNCFTLLRLNTQVHQSYTSDFTEKTTYEQPSELRHLHLLRQILITLICSAVVLACILRQKNETLMSIHECTRDTETPQLPVLPSNKLQWVFMCPAHPIYEIRVTIGILRRHHPPTYGTPATHPHCIVPHTAFLLPPPALPSRKQVLALP
jgi:hypothetical protein